MEKLLVTSNQDFLNHINNIKKAKSFTMDFESTNFDTAFYDDREEIIVIGAAFRYLLNSTTPVVFWAAINHHQITHAVFDPEYTKQTKEPFRRVTKRIPNQIDEDVFTKAIVELVEDPEIEFINHHLKFELKFIMNLCNRHLGRELIVQCKLMDSLASSYLLNKSELGLKTRALVDLGRESKRFQDIVPEGKEHLAHLARIEDMRLYAGDDVINSSELIGKHLLEMNQPKHKGKAKLLTDLEGPNVAYLAYMEHTGVLVDRATIIKAGEGFRSEMDSLLERFQEISGVSEDFNIRSTPQLIDLLFGQNLIEKLPSFKDSRGEEQDRAESTAKDYLKEIIAKELGTPEGIELCKIILSYRELATLHGNFIVSLLDKVTHSVDGRVHGKFNQFVTATSRLSSSDPNLQNIPVRSKNGRLVRKAFIARDGYSWVSLDYSQIEVRLLAHVSRCQRLLDIYREGLDIYKDVAVQHYGVDYDQVTPEQRQNMKSVVLGRNYGLGYIKYAMQQMIPVSLAKSYFASYDARFPELKQFAKECESHAKKFGYVRTVFGHTRSFEEELSKGYFIGNAASNLPIQGFAAGVLKAAQKAIMQAFIKKGWWMSIVYPLIQVHDELNFEVKHGYEQEALKIISDIMTGIGTRMNLLVPLEVSTGVGPSWVDAH